MNRLLDAVLRAEEHRVAAMVADGSAARWLADRMPSGESALPLAFRIFFTNWDKQQKVTYAKITAALKPAWLAVPKDQVPLPEAVVAGHTAAIDHVLATQPFDGKTRKDYEVAIVYALHLQDLETLRCLLDAGVPVDLRHDHQTLLMLACQIGWEAGVELLLARKADPNAVMKPQPNLPSISVLAVAAGRKSLGIVQRLVAAGADPAARNEVGETASDRAENKKIRAYFESLAAAGSHASLLDAVIAHALPSVRRFLAAGADLHAADKDGETPAMAAVRLGHLDALRLLLDAGARLDHPNVWSLALQDRPGKDIPAVVAELIARGVDVQRRDSRGMPPLFLANHPAEMSLLLEAGADPHATIVEPLTYINISHQALRLANTDIEASETHGKDVTIDPAITRIGAMGESHSRLTAIAQFFSSQNEAYFADPERNRTAENAAMFELYAVAKQAAAAQCRRLTALDTHKMYGNRKAVQLLRDWLGTAKDAYDLAAEELKNFARQADDSFLAEAERLAGILDVKPTAWKKRKGVLQFVAALHKTLPAYYGTEAESAAFSPDDALYGFEGILLARLQAEVQAKGYTLVWTEKRFKDRPLTRLLLLPSANDLTAIAACGTNRNRGEDSREVVNWCAALHASQPFRVWGASHDSMELGFDQGIVEPTELARKISEFCPATEVSPDDEAAAEAMGRELIATKRCFLWWD